MALPTLEAPASLRSMQRSPVWILIMAGLILLSKLPMHSQPLDSGKPVPQSFSRTLTIEQRLNYLLFLPREYEATSGKTWPMILFLHGAGERGTDLKRVMVHGPVKQAGQVAGFPFIVVSPQCAEGQTWDNGPLIGLLDEVISLHQVDTNRIYLTGLSMGGYGCWNLGGAFPERFAAMAPICGGGSPITIKLAGEDHKARLRQLPVWACHGARDSVVPLEESERMVGAYKQIGGEDVRLTVYPEATHDSWTDTYSNAELYDWFLENTR